MPRNLKSGEDIKVTVDTETVEKIVVAELTWHLSYMLKSGTDYSKKTKDAFRLVAEYFGAEF